MENWRDQPPTYLDSHDSARAQLAYCVPTDLLDAATRQAHTNHGPWFAAFWAATENHFARQRAQEEAATRVWRARCASAVRRLGDQVERANAAERAVDTLRGMVDQDGVRFLERERYILTLQRRWRILRAGQRRLKTEWFCGGMLVGVMFMEVLRWLVAP